MGFYVKGPLIDPIPHGSIILWGFSPNFYDCLLDISPTKISTSTISYSLLHWARLENPARAAIWGYNYTQDPYKGSIGSQVGKASC